jgi:hypothetical protein
VQGHFDYNRPMIEAIEELSFEEALLELEQTVAQLESGNLTLEASLSLFERGRRWPSTVAVCWTRPSCASSN